MSTSDINNSDPVKNKVKSFRKTAIVYLALSVIAIIIDNVYSLFGHGVKSAYMDYMFLYPLVGGSLLYFIQSMVILNSGNSRSYRLGYNIYNSGIATLTVGSFFMGILEIAGTFSSYSMGFVLVGWVFTIVGFILLLKTYL